VVDLMSALKQSLEKMEKKGPKRVERVEDSSKIHLAPRKAVSKAKSKKGRVA
jgi:hypothetical protein